MQPNKKTQQGFTLIELLVVIAIIGILSTLSIIALSNARAKSRDAKRVADIKQISTALDLYYADYGYYPTIITPGNPLVSSDGTKTYIDKIPNNPSPRNDSGCGDNNYTYASTSNNSDYSLNFCISSSVGSLSSGINSASGSSGLGSAPGLVGWWKFDEGSGSVALDSSGNGNDVSWNGTGVHYLTGKSGPYAGQFNGSDDYLSKLNAASCNIGLQNWTSLAWIKTNSSAVEVILNGVNPGLWHFYLSGGAVYGYLNDNSNTVSFWSSSTVNDGSWHQVAAVFNRGGNGQIYIDGQANGTPVNITSLGNVNVPNFFIGKHANIALYFFNGLIDDARLYNRALSAAEILALYNATK